MTTKYEKLQDAKWLEEQIKTKPLRQIAEEVGCSYSAIVHFKNKFRIGVPVREIYRKSFSKSDSCKKAYKKKYPNGRFGELAANWRGGRRLMKTGYYFIYSPDHPDSTKDGYVMEHHLVAEKKIGRRLRKDEDVHHINGNKSDNRPENLEVLTRKEHAREHFDAVKVVEKLNS